ncbi:MAG: hypothetical protein QM775_09530 [Pirellulales bacterium]
MSAKQKDAPKSENKRKESEPGPFLRALEAAKADLAKRQENAEVKLDKRIIGIQLRAINIRIAKLRHQARSNSPQIVSLQLI